jgi:hypothetical protein
MVVVAVASVATLWSSAAMATITQGDFSVFGFFESREGGQWGEGSSGSNGTNTRYSHPAPGVNEVAKISKAATETGGSFDFNHWDLDEMRQLADIRPDYHMVKNYKLLGRFDTLLLKDADFFAFYRPWYDAVGTLKNKGTAETNRDWWNYNHRELQSQYFRNDLREYYAQLNFTDNLSARIGKQQIIWSEADALSGTEVTNVVDTSYHGVYGAETPEDERKNVKMVKLNYILPDFLKTANNEVEGFWIPGDFQGNGPIVAATDGRNPWDIPIVIGARGVFYNQAGEAYRAQTLKDANLYKSMIFLGPTVGFADLVTASAFPNSQTFGRNPSNSLENSEFGTRIQSLLPIGDGLQASFIYLWEFRDDIVGMACTNCGKLSALESLGSHAKGLTTANVSKIAPGEFLVQGAYMFGAPQPGVPKFGSFADLSESDYKRNNFFGLTGTYYDKALTDIVYRYDTLWEPDYAVGSPKNPNGTGWQRTERARFIIAGDRPTYIPWISKQHTFLTFQYVNTWFPDRPKDATAAPTVGKQREISNFFFLAATNWLMNGQLTAGNVFEWDIDDNVGGFASTNTFRYSRNVLFGANTIWFLGQSGRNTDPFLYSRQQRMSLLEFTMTYEI